MAGGVALVLHGVPRTTLDLDIAVDGDRQEEVLSWLERVGYRCLHVSAGFSNHVHDEPGWGRVDMLYLRDSTKRIVLGGAQHVPGPGRLDVPVVEPIHVISMKANACKVDPGRQPRDLEDIRHLARIKSVPASEIRRIFKRYDVESLLEDLER